jgi:hypothetical protein
MDQPLTDRLAGPARRARQFRRYPFICALLGAAAALWAVPATAAPVTFLYQSTIDTTAIGGAPGTAISLQYTFESTLANGSGLGSISANEGTYGPFAGVLTIGGEQVSVGPAGTSIDVRNDVLGKSPIGVVPQDRYIVFGNGAAAFTGTIAGLRVTSFGFSLDDNDGIMFTDTSLPVSPGFALAADTQTLSVSLEQTGVDRPPLFGLGGRIGDTTPFSLTLADQVPEPAGITLLGIGLAGFGLLRRRRALTDS